MMDIELLGRQNPWWIDVGSIERDPFIEEFESSTFNWYPEFLGSLNLNKDLVYIVFGPRQVGKTTSFKLLVRVLLREQNVNPRSILYLNCEEIFPQTPQRLAELIDSYMSWIQTNFSGRLYILIDEATYIKDWERGIKILADRGRLKGVTVLATGSHIMGLRRGAERLPGRRGRGSGLDISLFPLNVREYLITHRPELKDKLPTFPGWHLKDLLKSLNDVSLFSEIVNSLFEPYIRTGGFPRSVRDWFSFGYIKPDVYKLYRDAFIGDLTKMGRREPLFKELAQWVLMRRQNAFEWSDIAQETYVGTHPTAREYVEDAQAAFVWDIFYKIKEMGKPLRAPRSPKKVYFKDPFIFHAIRAWVLGYQDPCRVAEEFLRDPSNLGYFIENLVASHLKRFCGGDVYYWRNGGEIDFVVFENGKKKALIELKYQRKVSLSNAKGLNKWGGGIILTRDYLALEGKILFIPVQYFLALLKKS